MGDSDALGGLGERGGEVMFIRGRLLQSDAVCCTYILFSSYPVSLHSMSVYTRVYTNIVRPCITRT